MEVILTGFQEQQLSELEEEKKDMLDKFLFVNQECTNFPFSYVRTNVKNFNEKEKAIFATATSKAIKNVSAIEFEGAQKLKDGFLKQLEDCLIILG